MLNELLAVHSYRDLKIRPCKNFLVMWYSILKLLRENPLVVSGVWYFDYDYGVILAVILFSKRHKLVFTEHKSLPGKTVEDCIIGQDWASLARFFGPESTRHIVSTVFMIIFAPCYIFSLLHQHIISPCLKFAQARLCLC